MSSVLTQYGIRLYSNDFKSMKWVEFQALLSGLGPDTPLGRIVQIRSEDDPEILKYFSKDQNRIRSEWLQRTAQSKTTEQVNEVLEALKQAFIKMAR